MWFQISSLYGGLFGRSENRGGTQRSAAMNALTQALSCRSCRPGAPFAELVCPSKLSVAEEYYAERSGNR